MSGTNRDVWSKRVQRWKDSGLTAKEFAAEAGLNASTLSYWSWKLKAEDRARSRAVARGGAADKRRGGGRSRSAKARFVEVSAAVTAASSLELVLAEGAVVRISADFDEAALTRVVRAVEAAR